MALLLDNDIVYKLAQLDLLQEAKTLLHNEFGELKVLDTLKFKLCPQHPSKRTKAEKKHGGEVLSRIEDFIDNDISEINCIVEDEALINALATNPDGLDTGEMQLLQALFDSENELLFTGDKRFLRALANADALKEKLVHVSESFICFEQIIYFLIKKLGFEQIKSKFIQALDAKIEVDKTLKCCFEGREQAIEDRVIENLRYYIDSIRTESGQLLSIGEKWLPIFGN